MRVSDHTPSEISMESAEMLFNPNVSYSLMDMSNNYKTWLYAMSGNSSCNELLCNTFNLTSTQLNMVSPRGHSKLNGLGSHLVEFEFRSNLGESTNRTKFPDR